MPRRNKSPYHQPYSPAAGCTAKRAYKTEALALDAATHQMLVKPTLELSVYHCDICRKWHLTRRVQLV